MDLTERETEEFTHLNLLAFQMIIDKHQSTTIIPLCWLYMLAHEKAKARQEILNKLTQKLSPRIPLTEKTAELYLYSHHSHELWPELRDWQKHETDLKSQRKQGQPAFFTE